MHIALIGSAVHPGPVMADIVHQRLYRVYTILVMQEMVVTESYRPGILFFAYRLL